MSRSDFYKRFLLVVTILLGIFSVGSYTVSADSTESGSAVVSFTHPTLNPANPRLPLADTSGDVANTGEPAKGQNAVVVDTTPEKTKVTDTSTSTRQSLPNTSARQSLPQTGTATMPMVLVLISIAMGLMMGWQVLTTERKLAK
ncbi:hypothetical protein [Lacticaseibacillus sp. N501-2]|uniref:hypothetical protein n=1 Tax=Lacticaseibacillus salsurae TaxID=3367729 RepID=UPI0038B231C5